MPLLFNSTQFGPPLFVSQVESNLRRGQSQFQTNCPNCRFLIAMHNLYIPRLHFSYLKMDSYPGCVKCVQFSDAVRGKLVNSVRRGAGFDTWRWQHSCHADVGGSDRQKRNVASNRRMWRWRALAEWENQPFQLHQRREFYLQLLFFLSYIHIYFPPMVWCRQMTLLYIGPGYYLDGWLSACRQVKHLSMYPTI